MPMVMNHELLFSTDLNYFKAVQIIGGRTIFERYNLASHILKNFDEKYRHFLAYPVKEDDKLEFHGIKSKIDVPTLIDELPEDEAEKYKRIKQETLYYYQTQIEELKLSNPDKAEFIADAIKLIDDRFVFCYDDKVVMGAWGMQLRDNVRLDITQVRKNIPRKTKKTIINEPPLEQINVPQLDPEPNPNDVHRIYFNAGDNGSTQSSSFINKDSGSRINKEEIPDIIPNEGYEFIGWSENPVDHYVSEDKEFIAQYRQIQNIPPTLPWWKRFWQWLKAFFTGKGCFTWLLRLLLFLLLLFLLLWFLKSCNGCNTHEAGGTALGANDSTWLHDDPSIGHDGGIYDPYKPYTPKPTPPGYDEVLPPQQGVLPPIVDEPEITPGNPSIIANRINILMENEDKSIMDFAKAFKLKYPDDKYKVVYYDDVVKRLQIEVPKEERVKLKLEIPAAFAPEYELFVFDESLFEGSYTPKDPAFSDPSKSWYLKAINATQAWDITRGSDKVTVAIVDNGFNLSHPELNSKVVHPYNVWLHSKEIYPQDVDHGTHVAGTALALADNGKGLCGIAPNCKFMPVQVADNKGRMTITSVLDGIIYALYQGADVINVSLGSSYEGLNRMPENAQNELIKAHFKEEERLWKEIMRIATKHNSTLVIAAGNDNILAGIDPIQRPDEFITVSAVDKNIEHLSKANFSNYGQYSTISAPGVGIYSCVGSNNYQLMDGTSMAAPVITGAVALMKSINPNISNKQIICILQNTGIATSNNIGKFIQLDKALLKVKSGGNVECKTEPTSGDVQILLSWNNYNDLDLIVTDPNNESVWFKNRHVSSNGQLEIDMNAEYPESKTPIENIYWPAGGAPNGTYKVYLMLYKKHQNIVDNAYTITVKHGGVTDKYTGYVRNERESVHICSFIMNNSLNKKTIPHSPVNRQSLLKKENNRL